jgi:hypothetical protein
MFRFNYFKAQLTAFLAWLMHNRATPSLTAPHPVRLSSFPSFYQVKLCTCEGREDFFVARQPKIEKEPEICLI